MADTWGTSREGISGRASRSSPSCRKTRQHLARRWLQIYDEQMREAHTDSWSWVRGRQGAHESLPRPTERDLQCRTGLALSSKRVLPESAVRLARIKCWPKEIVLWKTTRAFGAVNILALTRGRERTRLRVSARRRQPAGCRVPKVSAVERLSRRRSRAGKSRACVRAVAL